MCGMKKWWLTFNEANSIVWEQATLKAVDTVFYYFSTILPCAIAETDILPIDDTEESISGIIHIDTTIIYAWWLQKLSVLGGGVAPPVLYCDGSQAPQRERREEKTQHNMACGAAGWRHAARLRGTIIFCKTHVPLRLVRHAMPKRWRQCA